MEPEISKKEQNESPKDWKIKMLYDGDCPLCMREVFLYLIIQIIMTTPVVCCSEFLSFDKSVMHVVVIR